MSSLSNLDYIKETYSSFYNAPYVFPLPSRGLAAKLAFEFIKTHYKNNSPSVAVPINASELMLNTLGSSSFIANFCPINTIDFGLDYQFLNETADGLIYARDAYGIASSYCAGSQGRFAIEDGLDSPFTPYTGTGDIFYTTIPGINDVSILITKSVDFYLWLKRIIPGHGLECPSALIDIMTYQLRKKNEVLLNQLGVAHTFLKLLSGSIQTANVLCNYFSSIPLVLPKSSEKLIQISNSGENPFGLSHIAIVSPVDYGFKEMDDLYARTVIVKFTDTSLATLVGLAERIKNYLDSPISGA